MAVKNAYLERDLQATAMQFLALALPPDAFVTAFPAGGGGKVRGAMLKAMGLKPGFPDALIIWRGRAFMIELKLPTGRVSKAQIETHIALGRAGAEVAVCRSLKEIQATLFGWQIPLRAREAA